LKRVFFGPDTLMGTFLCLCRGVSGGSDPVIDSLCLMLNQPMQLSINKHSVTLFKNAPSIHFSYLSHEQRCYIFDAVSSLQSDVPTFAGFAELEDPIKFSVENNCVLLEFSGTKLNAEDVLSMLIECIAKSNKPRKLLYSLIIQRLHCKANLTRSQLQFARARSMEVLS